MDTVLLLGALIASLGIAAFGFLYFVSKDEDSYDKDARAKEKLIPTNTKNSSKGKKQKKGLNINRTVKFGSTIFTYLSYNIANFQFSTIT